MSGYLEAVGNAKAERDPGHMKTRALIALLLVAACGGRASQEGILPLSSFRLESRGIGESGRVVVTGAQNEKWEIVALRVVAFGREFSVPAEKLAGLAELRANGVRISYEGGFSGFGGRTIYIQLQMGFTSSTRREALITVTEEGKIDVGAVESRGAPSTKRPPSLLPPSSGPSPSAALLARSSERGGEAAAEDRSEALRIIVPRHCATDRLLMVTHLTGPFGGRGDCIRGTDGQTSYVLPLYPNSTDPSVGHGRAETVRIIAYCPGQQIATLELSDLDNLKSHEVAILFSDLSTRRIQCRVEFPDDVPKRPFKLVAIYMANSEHQFFRIFDGFLTQFEVLRTLVPESGEAQLMIPDFSRDRFTTNQTARNTIHFSAYDMETGNPAFELSPEELPAHEVLPDTLILRASPHREATHRGD